MRPKPVVDSLMGADVSVEQFAEDVRYYLSLTPRQLPSKYFYDALGSELFEAVCRLSWYGIARAECRLLVSHGEDLRRLVGEVSTVVELGPGQGNKLRLLLEAASWRQGLRVHLVDVSQSALDAAARTVNQLGDLRITTYCTTYDVGLREAVAHATGRTLVAFLGSSIGNFDPPGARAFLHNVRATLSCGDALLLGVDLVKPEEALLLAYDDPTGVTAAFNRNLLARINRELGGSFDIRAFDHRAVWNAHHSRVEMHLVSRSAQHVRIPHVGLDFRMEAGESIWTESSYKYDNDSLTTLLHPCGFRTAAQWVDRRDAFALTLAEAC